MVSSNSQQVTPDESVNPPSEQLLVVSTPTAQDILAATARVARHLASLVEPPVIDAEQLIPIVGFTLQADINRINQAERIYTSTVEWFFTDGKVPDTASLSMRSTLLSEAAREIE